MEMCQQNVHNRQSIPRKGACKPNVAAKWNTPIEVADGALLNFDGTVNGNVNHVPPWSFRLRGLDLRLPSNSSLTVDLFTGAVPRTSAQPTEPAMVKLHYKLEKQDIKHQLAARITIQWVIE
ncbi:hypothetical protein CCM_02595 [Cordyceps militaris CM01]|uniref:Uncharacterized protein n=1 Tax=Cordyceps militaris (strain CM01) TaxID=983644 RepID=G3JAK8_CORMM|nr:uncharacterized protein CCM_02595 [Cordyceps militaris CM01]EGX94324.1 hypothetical protein CCM_02595 [Cordyceps militaris CM01]